MKLYWVETGDRAEDWFVVARSARRAARWHEQAEGYGTDDAVATPVCRIPKDLEAQEGWPTDDPSKRAVRGLYGARHPGW